MLGWQLNDTWKETITNFIVFWPHHSRKIRYILPQVVTVVDEEDFTGALGPGLGQATPMGKEQELHCSRPF